MKTEREKFHFRPVSPDTAFFVLEFLPNNVQVTIVQMQIYFTLYVFFFFKKLIQLLFSTNVFTLLYENSSVFVTFLHKYYSQSPIFPIIPFLTMISIHPFWDHFLKFFFFKSFSAIRFYLFVNVSKIRGPKMKVLKYCLFK